MSRIDWNVPEGRFFDTGLDRGVLFPKGAAPIGEIVSTNRAYNAGVQSVDIVVEAARNLILNPDFKDPATGASDWVAWWAGASWAKSWPGSSLRLTSQGEPQTLLYGPPSTVAAVAAKTYTFRFRLRSTITGQAFRAMIDFRNAAGTSVGGVESNYVSVVSVVSGSWTDVYVVGVAPATSTQAMPYINMEGLPVTGDVIEVSKASFTEGPFERSSYFSGATLDANGYDYAWLGTTNASISVKNAMRPTFWESATPLHRSIEDGEYWVNARNGSWVYAHAEAIVGRYYAYVMTIRGAPGTVVNAQSSDYSVGHVNANTTMTIPATGELLFVVRSGPASASTQIHVGYNANADTRVSRVYVEEVSSTNMAPKNLDFFDGASTSNAFTFAWLGAAYVSMSTKREILTKAVPWFGLQSVDEEGGDSAAAYYIDGRPFLFLPRPKEFKATLKAITYPDAFSEIMGIHEVADGMYLDSQAGDSFDLAYRTLVGNGINGIDHGYKIHLVYNCTVAPQALTYESLSNSINPTSFSWEIQAVPVQVEGFRPTAHIIIDTRHMDQKKIDAVEALIYGSEDEVAHMPSPQTIFDLLSFGDTIIVTDNGDGTFDVTGSYENVYMVGDGIFRVDNVDGTDNGDGTFTISTTTE